MKSSLKKLKYSVPVMAVTLVSSTAFATTGGGGNPVTSAIQTEVGSLKTEAAIVIAAAVGLGLLFWGAKLLFGKFKSMAK